VRALTCVVAAARACPHDSSPDAAAAAGAELSEWGAPRVQAVCCVHVLRITVGASRRHVVVSSVPLYAP
jgi:hypothetical protein